MTENLDSGKKDMHGGVLVVGLNGGNKRNIVLGTAICLAIWTFATKVNLPDGLSALKK